MTQFVYLVSAKSVLSAGLPLAGVDLVTVRTLDADVDVQEPSFHYLEGQPYLGVLLNQLVEALVRVRINLDQPSIDRD